MYYIIILAIYVCAHLTSISALLLALGRIIDRFLHTRICTALGHQKSLTLTMFHTFTGCDTVSSFSSKGKRSAWETWDVFPSVQVLVKSGFANSFHLFEFSLHYFRNAHTLQLKSLPRPRKARSAFGMTQLVYQVSCFYHNCTMHVTIRWTIRCYDVGSNHRLIV